MFRLYKQVYGHHSRFNTRIFGVLPGYTFSGDEAVSSFVPECIDLFLVQYLHIVRACAPEIGAWSDASEK